MKPWQIILAIAAVAVLCLSLAFMIFGRNGPDLADRVLLVDVSTGQLFEIKTTGRTGIMLPERNPDTGMLALMPVVETAEGRWALSERYLADMEYIEVTPDALDESQSPPEVRVTSSQAKVIRR